MAIPLLDLRAQYKTIGAEINQALKKVLNSGQFILGSEVQSLEEEIADYCQVTFAVGVASGTDALLLALRACGIKNGDEVITTPFTFVATTEAICRTGAKPVFVDIDPRTYNLDVNQIEKKITPFTKAILPVHLYGHPAQMDAILELTRKHKVRIIEDAAQAMGAEFHGRKVGSFGDAGCLSFFPSKNLGGYGDGGMIITNDEEISVGIKVLRNHGAREKYVYQTHGYNSRLDAIQAAILRVKLKYLNAWNEARRKKAKLYNDLFKEKNIVLPLTAETAAMRKGVILPAETEGIKHVYSVYTIRIGRRDEVRKALTEAGVATEIYYPLPLHLQTVYASLGYKKGDFPASERIAQEVLSLPIYPELPEEKMEKTIKLIERFLK